MVAEHLPLTLISPETLLNYYRESEQEGRQCGFGSWKEGESQIWQCRKLRSTVYRMAASVSGIGGKGGLLVPPPLHTTTASPQLCQETGDLVYGESTWRNQELGLSGTTEDRTLY